MRLPASSIRPAFLLLTGLAAGLLVGAGMMIGTLTALSWRGGDTLILPERALHAMSASGNELFSIATGPVDDNGEGVYLLDGLTGDLSCRVIYPRSGEFGAAFSTNVMADLAIDQTKKPNLLMVTGQTDFIRGGGAARPARSVVYIVDANSGNFAAYGIAYRSDFSAASKPQLGGMTLIGRGKARAEGIRD